MQKKRVFMGVTAYPAGEPYYPGVRKGTLLVRLNGELELILVYSYRSKTYSEDLGPTYGPSSPIDSYHGLNITTPLTIWSLGSYITVKGIE